MIAVVIPYFQRQAGVLRKALASIAAQQSLPGPVSVIVVDDASPVAAAAEAEGLAWPAGVELRIVTQANGGPGAARNTGLGSVPPACRYVAFLDSDDEWTPLHLARATAALDSGFDFFFADHFQLGQSVGAFARAGRIRPDDHPALPQSFSGLHAYQGDMFDQILRGNVVGTSTVVYRFERFASLRFLTEFTTAGEDYLFWMSLATQGARTAFSSEVEAIYGKGVNVYSGSGWGTEKYLLRVHQEISYRIAVRRLFELNATQREHVDAELRRLRDSFIRDLLRRLKAREGLPGALLRSHARVDLPTFALAPQVVLRVLLGK